MSHGRWGGRGRVDLLDQGFTALFAALGQLVKAVDHGELETVDETALAGYAQKFEQHRNLLPLVDHGLVQAMERADLPTVLCQGNLTRVLTSLLGISKAEAARRVHAAAAVGGRRSMLGGGARTGPTAPG